MRKKIKEIELPAVENHEKKRNSTGKKYETFSQ